MKLFNKLCSYSGFIMGILYVLHLSSILRQSIMVSHCPKYDDKLFNKVCLVEWLIRCPAKAMLFERKGSIPLADVVLNMTINCLKNGSVIQW